MNDIQRSEEQILNKIKMARIKSTIVSAIGVIPILFISVPSFTTFSLFFKIEAYLLLTVVPFGFMYQIAFGYLFGRDVLTEVEKRRKYFKFTGYTPKQDAVTDGINASNGYGPGMGFIAAPPPKHW